MFGNDLYSNTTDQCLTMMNRCIDNVPRTPRGPPRQPPVGQPLKQEDEALVFAQGADNDKPTKGTPKNDSSSKSSSSSGSVSRGTKYRMVISKNCGQQGHVSSVCPQQKKPPEQVHAMATTPDDASVSSEDDSILIMAQTHEAILPPQRKSYAETVLTQVAASGPSPPSAQDEVILAQDTSQPTCHPISSDLLLFDSQSTVHLFSQPEHVVNIRPATNPIKVHCNKGTMDTT